MLIILGFDVFCLGATKESHMICACVFLLVHAVVVIVVVWIWFKVY